MDVPHYTIKFMLYSYHLKVYLLKYTPQTYVKDSEYLQIFLGPDLQELLPYLTICKADLEESPDALKIFPAVNA